MTTDTNEKDEKFDIVGFQVILSRSDAFAL